MHYFSYNWPKVLKATTVFSKNFEDKSPSSGTSVLDSW